MLGIQPEEKVLLEIRRHWLAFLRKILLYGFLAALPLIVRAMISGLDVLLSGSGATLLWFITASWWLIIWCFFAIAWTNYFLDIMVLTDRRLIDIEQLGIFSRDLAEMRLEKIQDIRVEVHGFLETLLGFGNLHVQTAGSNKEFVVRAIPKPYAVKDAILKAYDETNNKRL